MSKLSWQRLKKLVYERANGCCEYCQSCESITGQAMTVDHITPNRINELENLCLACSSCNQSKYIATSGIDPDTKQTVRLFNPRIDVWHEHFLWYEGGVLILGQTPIGRATIVKLRMNNERIVHARGTWIIMNNHPPKL